MLETHHAPTFYLPPDDVAAKVIPVVGETVCEWKGAARYFDVAAGMAVARRAAWAYARPEPAFAPIADHIAFYANLIDEAWIGDLKIQPQPGGFSGRWVKPNLTGKIKSAAERASDEHAPRLPEDAGRTLLIGQGLPVALHEPLAFRGREASADRRPHDRTTRGRRRAEAPGRGSSRERTRRGERRQDRARGARPRLVGGRRFGFQPPAGADDAPRRMVPGVGLPARAARPGATSHSLQIAAAPTLRNTHDA